MQEYKNKLIKAVNEGFFRANYPEYKALSSTSTAKDIEKLLEPANDTDLQLFYTTHDLYEIVLGDESVGNFTPLSNLLINILKTKRQVSNMFKADIPDDIAEVLSTSDNSYLVGGCVRDSLLGKTPKDFDFVTDIPYDELQVLFSNAGFTVKEEGKQFLVMIVSKDGNDYEVSNFRKDGTYTDGRRPEKVEIGTIYDDAMRRDFTINALYINLKTKELEDPTGQGVEDILSTTLRFVGKPEDRIKEDYLRGWRFFRFIKKGLNPDRNSLRAVRANWAEIYKNSNSERVLNELDKL